MQDKVHAKSGPFKIKQYLGPRYWPTWIGIGILRLLVLLPFRVQITLGKAIGTVFYWIPSRSRTIAQINIKTCFPELNAKEQQRLLREQSLSLGIALFEFGMCWWAVKKKLLKRVSITGLDILQKSIRRGKGVILLTPHFTSLEIGGSILNHYLPVAVLYREQNNKLFSDIMVRSRTGNCTNLIHRNNIREFMRCLKKNIPVWYAPDQNYGGKQFTFAKFFNIPAATTTATARLVQATGAEVLPFYQIRIEGDSKYKMVIGEPLKNFPSNDVDRDTATINKALEDMIRQAPGQYLWVHRRFKKRPDGEKKLY